MIKKFCVILALSVIFPAFAAKWVTVTKNSNFTVSYESESLRLGTKDGKQYVGVWVKKVLANPEQLQGKNYLSNEVLVVFNCTSRTMSVIQFIFFADKAGTTSVYAGVPEKIEINSVKTGTYGEDVIKTVCVIQ